MEETLAQGPTAGEQQSWDGSWVGDLIHQAERSAVGCRVPEWVSGWVDGWIVQRVPDGEVGSVLCESSFILGNSRRYALSRKGQLPGTFRRHDSNAVVGEALLKRQKSQDWVLRRWQLMVEVYILAHLQRSCRMRSYSEIISFPLGYSIFMLKESIACKWIFKKTFLKVRDISRGEGILYLTCR